jgi:hypothetical protein
MLAVDIGHGWSGSAITASSVSSMTIDITGATVGEYVYAWIDLRWSETALTFTGWTVVAALVTTASTGSWAVYKRLKVSGDTTFTLSWTATSTQGLVLLQQWPGTVADEGAQIAARTSAANVFTTPTCTSTDGNRWFVGFFSGHTGSSSNKTITWTLSGDNSNLDQSGVNVNGALSWNNAAIGDSNGPVSTGTHSATGTAAAGGTTTNNGGAAGLFLIPGSTFQPSSILQAVNRAGVI